MNRKDDRSRDSLSIIPVDQEMRLSSDIAQRGLSIIETLKVQSSPDLEGLTMNEHHDDCIPSVAISPEGLLFATASWDNSVYVWDTEKKKIIAIFRGHVGKVTMVGFAYSSKNLLTSGDDRTLRLWSIKNSTQVAQGKNLKVLSFSKDGSLALCTSEWGIGLKIISTSDMSLIMSNNSHNQNFLSGCFSPDMEYGFAAGRDGCVVKWDLSQNKILNLLPHQDWVWNLCVDHENKYLLTASSDGVIQLQNINNQNESYLLVGTIGSVYVAAFAPGGKHIISAGTDKILRVWDIQQCEPIQRIDLQSEILSLDVNERFQTVISGNRNGEIQIWLFK